MPITLLHWSFGNSKLERTKTVSFNLPAYRSFDGFLVCPGAWDCPGFCYALQGRYLFPDSMAARELNLAIARADLATFERLAKIDLGRIRTRSIRVHDSGDFFSQGYLDAWFRLCAAFPRKRFYAYSKSLHLDWSARPRNFELVQSVGGRFDALLDRSRSHTRVFSSDAARIAAGYCDGNINDKPAQRGEQRIGLVYHGSKPLTPAQRRYFTKQEIATHV